MATTSELELTDLEGRSRPLEDWLTTFPLLPVILDPYTHESAWILDTARRILLTFAEADCRPCWIVTCGVDDARRFLGPYAEELLTFADPDRAMAQSLGVEILPAFLLVRQDGAVTARAEGWHPDRWSDVAEAAADLTKWTRPMLPGPGDPLPYSGTPVAG
ncbi:MAG: TlpA family protein disulfide reductase [Acidimicrobiales bacterium]